MLYRVKWENLPILKIPFFFSETLLHSSSNYFKCLCSDEQNHSSRLSIWQEEARWSSCSLLGMIRMKIHQCTEAFPTAFVSVLWICSSHCPWCLTGWLWRQLGQATTVAKAHKSCSQPLLNKLMFLHYLDRESRLSI